MKQQPSHLLLRENTVLLLVDHQVGLLTGVRDISTSTLKHNVAGLAKACRILGVPVVVTSAGALWGPTVPELLAVLPEVKIIERNLVNAWDDKNIVKAIEATGRKQILIAGISLEVCAAFPAISAKAAGYDPRVVVDASGTFNGAKKHTGLLRLSTLGIQVTDYATAAVELLKDNADPKAHDVYGAINMDFANLVWQLSDAVKKGNK